MSTEEWLNLIPDKYRKYARAAILDEAEKAFDAGMVYMNDASACTDVPIIDKEAYINNLFNNDK